jgi:disulfide bond formation protein DsbB
MRWSEIPVRAWFAALALGAFGLVAGGMELQQLLRLAPCPLCIFQRLLFLVVGVLALGGALLPVARLPLAALIVAVATGGGAVAGYQSWMQAFPHLATECGYSDPNAIERLVDWLGMQWPAMFLATGFCTGRDWVFIGLSLANWSLLVFAGVVVLTVLLIGRRD